MSGMFPGTSLPLAPLGLLDQAPGHSDRWGSRPSKCCCRPHEGGWWAQVPPWRNCLWSFQSPASGTAPRAAPGPQPDVGAWLGRAWVLPSSVESLQGWHRRGCSESGGSLHSRGLLGGAEAGGRRGLLSQSGWCWRRAWPGVRLLFSVLAPVSLTPCGVASGPGGRALGFGYLVPQAGLGLESLSCVLVPWPWPHAPYCAPHPAPRSLPCIP